MELLTDILYAGGIVICFLMIWILMLVCEKLGSEVMNMFYIGVALIAAGLLVHLVIALLNAEEL